MELQIQYLCGLMFFTGSISDYNTLNAEVYNFMKFKMVIKGLIVIEKHRLEVDPIFAVSWTIFRVLKPKTHNANMMELYQCIWSHLTY